MEGSSRGETFWSTSEFRSDDPLSFEISPDPEEPGKRRCADVFVFAVTDGRGCDECLAGREALGDGRAGGGVVAVAGNFGDATFCRLANVFGVDTPPGAKVLAGSRSVVDRIKPPPEPSRARRLPSRDHARRCFSAVSFTPASLFAGEPGGGPDGRRPVIVGDIARRGWLPKLPSLPSRRSASRFFSVAESGDSHSSSLTETEVSPPPVCGFLVVSVTTPERGVDVAAIFAFAAAAARPSDVAVTALGCRRGVSVSVSASVSSLLSNDDVERGIVADGARGDLPIIFSKLA